MSVEQQRKLYATLGKLPVRAAQKGAAVCGFICSRLTAEIWSCGLANFVTVCTVYMDP